DLHDHEVPLVVRVLYGIGETVLLVDPYKGTTRPHVPPMPSVKKRSGTDVSTRVFMEEASATISGVLFARVDVCNLFPMRTRRLYLAHHPTPLAAFRVGALPLRGEIWIEHRVTHAGRVARYGPLSKRRRWPREER